MIVRIVIFESEFQEEQDKPLIDERLDGEQIAPMLTEIRELLEESWLGDWEEDDA